MIKLARLALLAILVALPFSAGACAAVAPIISALPDVIAAVTDAAQILDAIEHFVDQFFAAKPDAEKEKVVRAGIAKTRGALNAALRVSKGAQKLDQQKVDEAFGDFKVAYQELLGLVGPLGVRPAGGLKATPGGLEVPEPIALTLKVSNP